MNGVMCYFPKCVLLQGNHCAKGSNIDISKLESKTRIQHFFFQVFKKNYIVIWSYMLLEHVLQVFPLLVPQAFFNQFVFIWGHE
jgi:hypothetical protein